MNISIFNLIEIPFSYINGWRVNKDRNKYFNSKILTYSFDISLDDASQARISHEICTYLRSA